MAGNTTSNTLPTYVWDIVVRACHIIFIVGVVSAFISYELGMMEWHIINGYVVLAAVVVRIIWGFIGTPYARFTQFLVGPGKVLEYVRNWRGHAVPTGHNPLGAYAVLALLAALLNQTVAGLFSDDGIMASGPLAQYVDSDIAEAATEWHEFSFFYILLPLIGLHIAAALVYLLVKKANLIKPMITGYKD